MSLLHTVPVPSVLAGLTPQTRCRKASLLLRQAAQPTLPGTLWGFLRPRFLERKQEWALWRPGGGWEGMGDSAGLCSVEGVWRSWGHLVPQHRWVGRRQWGRDPWEMGDSVTEKPRRKGCDYIMALSLTSWVAFGKWLNFSVSTDSPVN